MSITGLNVSKKESPTVKLISLANSDPGLRPRFSLALANLASAIRNDVAGEVSQHDQQLCDKDHIIQEIDSDRPDIIGISVPFGTHEVFSTLLQRIRFCMVSSCCIRCLSEVMIPAYRSVFVGVPCFCALSFGQCCACSTSYSNEGTSPICVAMSKRAQVRLSIVVLFPLALPLFG